MVTLRYTTYTTATTQQTQKQTTLNYSTQVCETRACEVIACTNGEDGRSAGWYGQVEEGENQLHNDGGVDGKPCHAKNAAQALWFSFSETKTL